MVLVTGNTYPVKDAIKALGGQWDRAAKGWRVPDDRAAEAFALVDAAGPARSFQRPARRPAARRGWGYGASYQRFGSDEVIENVRYSNPRGRCEDAPCCGCCS